MNRFKYQPFKEMGSTSKNFLKNLKISNSESLKRHKKSEEDSKSDSDSDNEIDEGESSRCCKNVPRPRCNFSEDPEIKKINFNRAIFRTEKKNKSKDSTRKSAEKFKVFEVVEAKGAENDESNAELMEVDIPTGTTNIESMHEEIYVTFFDFFSNEDKFNFILASNSIMYKIGGSITILRRFTLPVNKHNLERLTRHHELLNVPFLNVELDLEYTNKQKEVKAFYMKIKNSVEILKVKNAKLRNYHEFLEIFGDIPNLTSLTLEKCSIDFLGSEVLPKISTFKTISFHKCNDNVFTAFMHQTSVEKIMIRNDDWTWNGFPHDTVNEMLKNCKNPKHIVLIGAGTGSFFDSDEFSFKIEKLDTTMITFHWYVGIKTQRVSFLRSQIRYLKDLTIHQLPNDFDGGRVLKFIFTDMKLQNFYYGKIPLILNGKKQQVKYFEATEIQIQSALEMVRQFPSITSFCLKLNATDIASEEIEKVINPPTDLFNNIEEFEVIDDSKYRGILGVFLGLFKNLRNLRRLSFKTQDRNINVLLEECLPYMHQLSEIYLTSNAGRSMERWKIIRNIAQNLKKISVSPQYFEEAKRYFGNDVEVCKTEEN